MGDHHDYGERLHFTDGAGHYDPYEAAQHVVRYACVKDFVRGARVLDVACGEGYGSRLLSEWGAREVVGVDISPEAIAAARQTFGGEGLSFLVGNVETVDTLEGVDGLFDVIASFETIEHIDDPTAFLRAIRSRLAPGGVIAISCPNEEGMLPEGESNPFHVRRLDFEAFRALTEGELGKASSWLLGTPVFGEINLSMDLLDHRAERDDAAAIARAAPVDGGLLLPALALQAVSPANCTHYLGLWGQGRTANAALSAQSYDRFVEPWRAITWFKDQQKHRAEEHENQIKTVRAEHENQVRALKHAAMAETETVRQRVLDVAGEVTQWHREALRFEREATRLRPFEIEAERLRPVEIEAERLRPFEIEANRLQAETISLRQHVAALEAFRLSTERSRLFRLVKLYARFVQHPTLGKPLRFARRAARTVLGR